MPSSFANLDLVRVIFAYSIDGHFAVTSDGRTTRVPLIGGVGIGSPAFT